MDPSLSLFFGSVLRCFSFLLYSVVICFLMNTGDPSGVLSSPSELSPSCPILSLSHIWAGPRAVSTCPSALLMPSGFLVAVFYVPRAIYYTIFGLLFSALRGARIGHSFLFADARLYLRSCLLLIYKDGLYTMCIRLHNHKNTSNK